MEKYTKAALAVALTALAVISAAVIFTPDADDPYAYANDTVAVVVDQNGVETEYPSLQAAVDAAEEGQTVRLIRLISELQYTLSKSIILDLNGQSIHYAGNALTVAGGADVLIKNGSLNCRIAGDYYALTVSEGATVTAYNVTFYGKLNNAGNLTICNSFWNDKIDNTGGDLTLINSKIDVDGSNTSYIVGGNVTAYNSYIRIGLAVSIFASSESVTVYGGFHMSGSGNAFRNVNNVNIYGGTFDFTNYGVFRSTSSLNVHGGLFYGLNSDKTLLSGSLVEGHEMYANGNEVFVMYDLYGCEECGELDCTTGHFDNKNDLEHRDLLVRFASTDSVCASILAIDLHDLMPSIYAEGTYGYYLYSQNTQLYLQSKGGASYSSLSGSSWNTASYRWIVTEHTDSPDTPGSGTGTGDDDAGDLPPNVGPSASNSASGSSDSRTISIIAAAVVVIAMGIGALFVFREH